MPDNERLMLKNIYEIVLRLEQWKDDHEAGLRQFWEKDWKELKEILGNHEKRIGKLEKWQATSVGIAIACSTLLGILIKVIKL